MAHTLPAHHTLPSGQRNALPTARVHDTPCQRSARVWARPQPCLLHMWPQRQVSCHASTGTDADAREALRTLKLAKSGVTVDPAYALGATYLKQIGFSNPAEISRVLDIAMNPNSLFIDYARGNRAKNASARSLDVDKDMRPVVDFLLTKGLSKGDVIKVISGHPPVLSYDVNTRLEPFWSYLAGLGVQDMGAAIAQRPTLLGLEVENVRKITEYLQSIETPPEEIVRLLCTSI